jgi:branched-chain amino acid aminotransferase
MIYCTAEGLGLGKPSPTAIAVFCQPLAKIKLREFDAKFATLRRIPPEVVPSTGKITGSYVGSFMAQREIAEQGASIALMKTIDGHVAEAFGMNLFAVKKDSCITSPLSAGPLDGITRRSVIEFCERELGMRVEQRLFTQRLLYNSREVFLCGTGGGVNSLTKVDGREIGSGKAGPVTKKLWDIYWSAIHAKNSDYESWYHVISG